MIFRFIGGLGVGGSSVLGPMYIAEIAPAKLRGRLVGFFQFNVVLGILVAYFSNYLISLQHLGSRRMALGTGCHCNSGGVILRHAVYHSSQPTLAGQERPCGRSPKRVADHRRRKLRTRLTGNCCFHQYGAKSGDREAVHPKICFSDLSGGQHRNVQPTLGDQRDSLLLERHF